MPLECGEEDPFTFPRTSEGAGGTRARPPHLVEASGCVGRRRAAREGLEDKVVLKFPFGRFEAVRMLVSCIQVLGTWASKPTVRRLGQDCSWTRASFAPISRSRKKSLLGGEGREMSSGLSA